MAMINKLFTMDAKRIQFINSKHNPTQIWFARMIRQLISNASEVDWNTVDLTIKMHSELWGCISRLYSYGHYYDNAEEHEKNCYLTEYTAEAQSRHKEYLSQKALPILGRLYPIELDDNMSLLDVLFITNIDGISGIIKNINCKVEYSDKTTIHSYYTSIPRGKMALKLILWLLVTIIAIMSITIYAAYFDVEVTGSFYVSIGYRLIWAVYGIVFFELGKWIWR